MQETTFPSLYVSFHPIICLYVFLLAFYLSIMISWLYWQAFLCPFCLPLHKGLLRLTQIMGIPLRRLVIIMCCRWTRIHLTFRYVVEQGNLLKLSFTCLASWAWRYLAKSLCMLIKQLFISYIEQYTCTYLQDAIEKLMASGNVDNPEGGLEALVQVAACEKVGQ